ncbi:MAG: hypothetical protein NVSMB14_05710 [Isosphaeraceae bacterium]
MALLVTDPLVEEELIADRRARGIDRYDEVWEGVYVLSPLANDEHQYLASELSYILRSVLGGREVCDVRAGVNVSDRDRDWTKNYRAPDVAVRFPGGKAIIHKTHWQGGPDFAVEIVSKGDRTREKFEFYSKIGVRELLIVDRDPWALELYRLKGRKLTLVGKSTLANTERLESVVVPLSFRLKKVEKAARIEVEHGESEQKWLI